MWPLFTIFSDIVGIKYEPTKCKRATFTQIIEQDKCVM